MSKVPVLAAYAFKKFIGHPFLYPDNSLNLTENFLHIAFGVPTEAYELDPGRCRSAGHDDHLPRRPRTELLDFHGPSGRFITRQHLRVWKYLPVSTPCSGHCTVAPNEAVLNMLDQIKDAGLSPEEFMDKVKDKESGIRLMGFGHRVYEKL